RQRPTVLQEDLRQRPDLDTLACVNPDCQWFRLTGQDNLTVRKVYGQDSTAPALPDVRRGVLRATQYRLVQHQGPGGTGSVCPQPSRRRRWGARDGPSGPRRQRYGSATAPEGGPPYRAVP